MATEQTSAVNWLDAILAELDGDQARWNFCTSQIKNKLAMASRVDWQLFCCWKWLEANNTIAAAGFLANLQFPEQLSSLVAGKQETARREKKAKEKILENWAGFNFVFRTAGGTDYTPERFSIGLLEKLAELAERTPGMGNLLAGQLARDVRARLRGTGSTVAKLKPGDVDEMLRAIRGVVPASASRLPVRPLEQGRAAGPGLEDVSSSRFLSDAPPPPWPRRPRQTTLQHRIRRAIMRELGQSAARLPAPQAQQAQQWVTEDMETWLGELPEGWRP
ncbi:hypothetical protein AC578_5668 [Pseudocercospora eumusae]|uniref:Uncharacterized protein n=1 Tax=Pseudocercospora eumusae TaxID=321146 RepID=A0A139H3C2_9PEZI|nr:hypothetical protein AC578_5668 [Pseudocercospora eumusae]